MDLSYDQILNLTGRELGRHDVACPECGPGRRTKANQTRKVLRVWLKDGFASYGCARCGIKGYAREAEQASTLPRPKLKSAEPDLSDEAYTAQQHRKALYLSKISGQIKDTPVETYLRQHRRIVGPLPETFGYLAPRKSKHHPAMIAPYGLAQEPEPGVLRMPMENIFGIHLTLLAPDGRGKAGVEPNKITVGKCLGYPIVIAPMTNALSLIVTEGIEDGLSAHQAAPEYGVWAAGAGGRMPSLAETIPSYTDCVTIITDDDETGRRGAFELRQGLIDRGIETFISINKRAAA